MIAKMFSCCIIAGVVGFAATLGTMYCVGRWGLLVGPELLFGKGIGLIVSIAGCAILSRLVRPKENSIFMKGAAFCLTGILLLASLSKASILMMETYVNGLEKAFFSVASFEQWESTLKSAERYKIDPPKVRKGFPYPTWDSLLKTNFVMEIYEDRHAYTYLLDDNKKTNNLHIMINWRGASFDPAVEIGKLSPNAPELSDLQILYRKDVSNSISFMILR